jgi:hypothetical protein|tara:strand:+ start:501 stop:629 length:129 start_codon:yes stop_codon:yes gene_type:complete
MIPIPPMLGSEVRGNGVARAPMARLLLLLLLLAATVMGVSVA